MKAIIISDYFEEEIEKELKKHSKSNYNKSGLNYEKNLYLGFESIFGEENVQMFCCPTCGSYPNETTLLRFPQFVSKRKNIRYVKFLNVLYIRNIFRYINLKKAIRKYIKTIDKKELCYIIVIQMHYPFMKACDYFVKKHKNSKTCINIWDYPNFVDFRNNNFLKRTLKKYNYNKTLKMLKNYDLYFYLCQGMKEKNPYNDKYIVHEGIISSEQIEKHRKCKLSIKNDGKFHIVYTGRLTEYDGVLDLINAVISMKDETIVLEIAGGGEETEKISDYAKNNQNIVFHGLLSTSEIIELQNKADLFVLPRLPEEYTNYSFPSKMCEYILAGAPILTRPLDCFDSNLREKLVLFYDADNSKLKEYLKNTIGKIKKDGIQVDYSDFIKKNTNTEIVKEIVEMLGE